MSFELFFREHYGEVVRSLRLLVRDDARAEELAQEAFVRAFRNWRRVAALERPVAWVYVVACNEARHQWRRESRSRAVVDDVRPIVADSAGVVVTKMQIHEGLEALTDRQRAAVVLRYVADLPLSEIGEVMGCATGTVKATLHQALARLRIEMEATDDES